MKRNYICTVDAEVPAEMRHASYGRYRVGAKNPRHARQLLRKCVKEGRIQVFCSDDTGHLSPVVPYGTCVLEIHERGKGIIAQIPLEPAE